MIYSYLLFYAFLSVVIFTRTEKATTKAEKKLKDGHKNQIWAEMRLTKQY